MGENCTSLHFPSGPIRSKHTTWGTSSLHPIRDKYISWYIRKYTGKNLYTSHPHVIRHIQDRWVKQTGVKTLGLLSPINNSPQHFRNFVSMCKRLEDWRHFVLCTVTNTKNITLAFTEEVWHKHFTWDSNPTPEYFDSLKRSYNPQKNIANALGMPGI